MSHRSRNSKRNRTTRIDTLLLAKYGIIQPTRRKDAITLVHPLNEYDLEDRRDLQEFAEFLMAVDRSEDVVVSDQERDDAEDGRLHDEP